MKLQYFLSVPPVYFPERLMVILTIHIFQLFTTYSQLKLSLKKLIPYKYCSQQNDHLPKSKWQIIHRLTSAL